MLPPSVQPANSISATSSGFSQCTSRVFFGASLPPNGLLSEAAGLQRRHDAADGILPEAGADHADEGQMVAAIDAGHQRAEFSVGGLPAAEHDLLPAADLGLGPAFGAAGAIGRVELLGDDALELQLFGGFQHGIAAFLEMLDVTDQSCHCPCAAPARCFSRALRSRNGSERRSSPPGNSRSNAKKIRLLVLPSDDRRLQRRKIRDAVVIERSDLAVDQHIGKRLRLPGDGAELFGPVQSLAGVQRDIAILDPQLHAITVELDLVAPAVGIGRAFDRGTKLRRDEIGHRRNLLRLGGLRR